MARPCSSPRLGEDDYQHARQDHRHRSDVLRAEALLAQPGAQAHRNHRVGVAAGQGRTHVMQQPHVSGERHDRAEHPSVCHGQHALRARPCLWALADQQAGADQQHATAQHLSSGGHERRRQIASARPHRAERPADRCDQQQHQPTRRRGQTGAGVEPHHAHKADHNAQPFAAAGMLPAQCTDGTVATAVAASPDDTLRPADTTIPLPSSNNAAPISATFFHCARVGAATLRQRSTL
ncbi:ribonuclease E [Xanthomonas oryzae pv. oryzae KACC 10331]|uniref:Ribonuclease E n=1 Tax=Xanthomonas oryzae pv. oryzae (strain KACC10331 / KXO85) TaxID=291331 RepID=Q5H5S5_XANOR|nr:ribonuclease E [Xanthomonas oryzae pv. oryzae KACC 10331]